MKGKKYSRHRHVVQIQQINLKIHIHCPTTQSSPHSRQQLGIKPQGQLSRLLTDKQDSR